MKHFLLLVLIGCYSNFVLADIYMQQDAHGNVTYSDTPLPNGKKIEVSETNTSSELNTPSTVTATEIQAVKANPANQNDLSYQTFLILSPKDQETFQNQPIIPVTVSIAPQLKKGHKVQIYLDGQPYGDALAAKNFELHEIERGIHQLAAVLLDANNKIIKESNTITIYVHRASVNSPTRASLQPGRNVLQFLWNLVS